MIVKDYQEVMTIMAVMTNKEFATKLRDIANNYKTLYVMGCFGAPMTAANKKRYKSNHSYNKQAARQRMIDAATSDTFGFDCVCLIKGILWGWDGDTSKTYGGATYASNGVPDLGADTMITKCLGVTKDFSTIEIGEAVWMTGHIGVYVGNGQVVECTPAFKNKVQITNLANVAQFNTGTKRKWNKHGKLPYIEYLATDDILSANKINSSNTGTSSNLAPMTTTADAKSTWDELMKVINNAYGVAGLMGNLNAESGLIAINLQNSYNTKLGYTDVAYTQAVDNGKITRAQFIDGSAQGGYGLAQWTYSTRKAALYDYAKSKKASIGNRAMQVQFLIKELNESFSSVMKVLKSAKSVQEASDIVLTQFERPANMSQSVKDKRASYGMTYYNTYAKSGTTNESTNTSTPNNPTVSSKEVKATGAAKSFNKSYAGTYEVTANAGLNIRNTPSTSGKVLTTVVKGTRVQNYGYYTITNGVVWLYVQFMYNNVKYTGHCSIQYLKKVK